MKDYQTPQKEQSRPSDLANRRSKESQLKKSQKKSLNAAFSNVPGDFSPEITKEPIVFSPIPELSEDTFNGEIGESFTLNPAHSASSEPFNFCAFTPSSTTTINENELSDHSSDHHQFIKSNGSNNGSEEAAVLANLPKGARVQVLNSIDVNTKPKKLLDALIKFVIDEFYTIPGDTDRFTELVSTRRRMAFMCLSIWILAALLIFFDPGPQRSYTGALPT